MDWTGRGARAQNIGARAGDPPSRSFLNQWRGWLPFVENLHPRFGRLADSSRSPKCSRSALPLIGRSRSINHSQSISLGGRWRGEGEVVRRGSESLGVFGGAVAWMDWTGPAGGCRRCRHRYRHRQMCTCRPRTLSLHAPPLHPAPCTAEPGQPLLLLPPHQPDDPGHPMLRILSFLGRPGKLGCRGIHPPCSLPKSTSDSHAPYQHHRSRQRDHVLAFPGPV